jgi:hypothetical protein
MGIECSFFTPILAEASFPAKSACLGRAVVVTVVNVKNNADRSDPRGRISVRRSESQVAREFEKLFQFAHAYVVNY